MTKKLVVGILAHVDAGKTTLSEGLLYLSGKIQKMGRVDNQNAYLDTYELEKSRGITIFSKQALFEVGDTQFTLLDTPGHVDFSAEMERTLQVLDYAILVISGTDGVQQHTRTLWKLLDTYKIPTFIFINKMDQPDTNKEKLLSEIIHHLHANCIDFEQNKTADFYEKLAVCDDLLMDEYLKSDSVSVQAIRKAVNKRTIFPCFFGSALKLLGVEELIEGLVDYTSKPSYFSEFGAKIFKISRDEQGNRLTHMKITGGTLKVKDLLSNGIWKEKVNQIRLYSGKKYDTINEVDCGSICAVTGLSDTRPGEGLGADQVSTVPILEPVLSYRILLPEGCDPKAILPSLRQLEEEEPELHILWNESLQEIQIQVMGEIQIEILKSRIISRFGVVVEFDTGRILYKETITNAVEGVGHFEPLKHYAEVHLLLETGEKGSGLQFENTCREELLAKNWQRLVLTHLQEKQHRGVLGGFPITDIKITLLSGRAHNKHTEGGDFREATYRAVRQGLKQAQSLLLEPYYSFQLELPEKLVGRAMTDIEKMHGVCEISQTVGGIAFLTGSAPVVTMQNYQKDVNAYTKGLGKLFCTLKGYDVCHNAEQVLEEIAYDSEKDIENPTGSVFCAHGSGFFVSWDEAPKYMHVESSFQIKNNTPEEVRSKSDSLLDEKRMSLEEINQIINSISRKDQVKKTGWKVHQKTAVNYNSAVSYGSHPKEKRKEYLLVDGYNIIYAWPELKQLVDEENMDGARNKLLDYLSNYQAICKTSLIVVFDAYRVEGHQEEIIDYHNIHVVYTKQAQTADQYIEKFAYNYQGKYHITVATSDGLQQIIVRGTGASLLSARELKIEAENAKARITQEYEEKQKNKARTFKEALSPQNRKKIEDILIEKDKQ